VREDETLLVYVVEAAVGIQWVVLFLFLFLVWFVLLVFVRVRRELVGTLPVAFLQHLVGVRLVLESYMVVVWVVVVADAWGVVVQ